MASRSGVILLLPMSLSSVLTDEKSTLLRRHVGGDAASDFFPSRSSNQNPQDDRTIWKRPIIGFILVGGMLFATLVSSRHPFLFIATISTQNKDMLIGWNTLGPAKPTGSDNGETSINDRNQAINQTFSYGNSTDIPVVRDRCEWVMKQFHTRDIDYTPAQLEYRYKTQSTDANVFYRATAHIFWNDFVSGHWDDSLTKSLKESATLQDGVSLDRMSTYTWVTGDQHLSNFGAFLNRHGDVVFGINDFDEGAIYDFQVDVLRIAVSVYNHAVTNGLDDRDVAMVLEQFTDSYVNTVLRYIGNEDALLFELTAKTTSGFLRDFLKKVQATNSYEKQMKKYTKVDEHGRRSFYKGPIGSADPDTKLATLPREREEQIRSVFTATKYGATMMKLGWLVREWDDDFFTVLDVASRVGSGVGSSGVDRFYVLLKGTDGSFDVNGKHNSQNGTVVLDVKYEPPGAVTPVLTPDEAAWYQVLFPNDAARAVEAQRRLTSFTDPYTGWVILPDDNGDLKPFSVRQRSPWKDSPDLDKLTNPEEFSRFMSQIAVSTATSHVRGSVGKKPGSFKNVVQALLGKHSSRRKWGNAVTELAKAYSKQVVLDYDCFASYVQEMYPP